MIKRSHFLAVLPVLFSLLIALTLGQFPGAPPASPPPPPVNQSDDPLLKNFRWRAIGPAIIGGRIDDIAVVDSNPYVLYIDMATGGVWKPTNTGTTWEP